jgi:hypothetical protein
MTDIIQNLNVWFTLTLLYFGIFLFIIGLARHQNNIISGIGMLIVLSGFIFGVLKTSLITSIIILIFAYFTRSIIPSYLAYLYWKLKYKPKFLTHLRFQFLVSDQDKKPETVPLFKDFIIDVATEKGLGEKITLQKYADAVFESGSKYIVDEVLGNYNIFSYYVHLKSKYNMETTNNIIKKELGIIPLSKMEQDLKTDEIFQNIRNLEKKNSIQNSKK